MSNAAIIGAGLIGRAWSMVFARAGWQVRLFDSDPAQVVAARDFIAASLAEQVQSGLVRRCGGASHASSGASPRGGRRRRRVGAGEPARGRGGQAARCSRRSIAAAPPERSSRARRRRFRRRASPRRSRDAPAAWSRIRSIRRISCRWSSCAARRGRRRPRSSARARCSRRGPGADRRPPRGRRLHPQPAAGRAPVGGDAPGRRGLRVARGPRQDDARRPGLRWSFMGPFATIELNAPGGVADYAQRYAGFYRRLAADPPSPAVWDAEDAGKVAAALGTRRQRPSASAHGLARPPADGARGAQAAAAERD